MFLVKLKESTLQLRFTGMKAGWSNDTPQYWLDKGYTYEYLSNGYFLMEIGKFEIFV